MNQFSSAIVSEIVEAIGIINKEFPELYKNLDETPIWLNKNTEGISQKEYQDYAEALEVNIFYFEKNIDLQKYIIYLEFYLVSNYTLENEVLNIRVIFNLNS